MSSNAQQAPGSTRIDLQQHDLSVPGREVIQNRVEISSEALRYKHFHYGEEIIYVLEGELEYQIEGEPTRTAKAGEVLMGPAEAVHAVKNIGGGDGAELATFVCREGEAAHHARRVSNEVDKGGHFAAWEDRRLLTGVRACVGRARSSRSASAQLL